MDLCCLPNDKLNECAAFPDKDGVGCYRHDENFRTKYPHLYTLRSRIRKQFQPFPYRDETVSDEQKSRFDLMETIWEKSCELAMQVPSSTENGILSLETRFAVIYANCKALGFTLTADEEEYFATLRRRETELKADVNKRKEALKAADDVYQRELAARRQLENERMRRLALQEAEARKLKAENDIAELTSKLGDNKIEDITMAASEDDFVLPARK